MIPMHGYSKINKKRMVLTENTLIAPSLGKHGIICTEDGIHEFYTVGKSVKEANSLLWPFRCFSTRGNEEKHHPS